MDDDTIVAKAVASRFGHRALHKRIDTVIKTEVRRALGPRQIGNYTEEDIVQHIWTKLWENDAAALRKFDGSRSSLPRYAMLFAQGRIRELWRKELNRQGLLPTPMEITAEPADNGPTPEGNAVADELFEKLVDCLRRRLPNGRGRAMLEAFYLRWLSVDVIAEEMQVERQVVFRWQTRLRNAARACLESLGETDEAKARRENPSSPRREEL